MRDSVRDGFVGFTSPLEGVVKSLYLDVEGLVTIAVGNLVDPMRTALSLPLLRPDGSRATSAEIAAAWGVVKNDENAKRVGYQKLGWPYYAKLTSLRLDDDGVKSVVGAKLDLFDRQMLSRFPTWETFPADAQLAILSMCWACGGGWQFPLLEAAIDRRDWGGSANSCHMNETNNGGLRPRNFANKILFLNAAYVEGSTFDPGVLYWPRSLVDETPTETDLPNPPSEPTQIVHPAVDFGEVALDPDKADE